MFKPSQLLRAVVLDSAALLVSIKQGLATDPIAQAHLCRLQSQQQHPELSDDPWTLSKDGEFLLFKGALYVPDHADVRLDVLCSCHDHRLAGHPGIGKMVSNIRHQFYWPRLVRFITDYVRSCSTCHQSKSVHHKPFGPLRFLPIAIQPWDLISMDFIEGLPLSDGYDTILVIVCRLSKMALFIATHRDIDTKDLAMLFLVHVFSKHGTPSDIISDHRKHFISRFW